MEELLGEISSLASVYHKPEETFIGRGRVGVDAVRKGTECVFHYHLIDVEWFAHGKTRLTDDRFSTQKALQTVVAGQQAENLL